ncbi:MAG: type I toxin-antitoxin system SymE family toxin, partial [bacterium]|nr:type I toxin-antitoxin system SymE family toxin [bacterium]
YRPVQIEPYTLLRGQWLEKAGFTMGQKIIVQVSHQQLIITPSEISPAKL